MICCRSGAWLRRISCALAVPASTADKSSTKDTSTLQAACAIREGAPRRTGVIAVLPSPLTRLEPQAGALVTLPSPLAGEGVSVASTTKKGEGFASQETFCEEATSPILLH